MIDTEQVSDITTKPKRKSLPPHWYKFYTRECVLCGAGETIRVRMYTPKPTDQNECFDFEQFACSEHFM